MMNGIVDFFGAWWGAWTSLFAAGQFQIDNLGYLVATLPLVFVIGIAFKIITIILKAGRWLFKK